MASSGGGGASVQSTKKKSDNSLSNLFTAILINLLKEGETGDLMLASTNETVLAQVAKTTAGKLGSARDVARAYGNPARKCLLEVLGLCLEDLTPASRRPFIRKTYELEDVLRLATGCHTAIWQIIKDYRDVCHKLDTASLAAAPPIHPKWAHLRHAVFTVVESKATIEEKRLLFIKLLGPLEELWTAGEVAQAQREEEESVGWLMVDEHAAAPQEAPPRLMPGDTHWVDPSRNKALYRLLFSLHLRGRPEQRGKEELEPPGPTQVLRWQIPPEAYLYLRELFQKIGDPAKDAAFEAAADAEQATLNRHRAAIVQAPQPAPEQAPQGGGAACDGSHCAVPVVLFPASAPALPAPPSPFLPHPAALSSLRHDTPVVKHMLSDPHRDGELRLWEGVYGLLGVLSHGGSLVFVRQYDWFERRPNDGDVPFSRLGRTEDLPPDFAGHYRITESGQRAGRMGVRPEVASPFDRTLWKRDTQRLVFDATGTQLLGFLDGEGDVIPLDPTESLHLDLQAELTKAENQVLRGGLRSGWVLDLHKQASQVGGGGAAVQGGEGGSKRGHEEGGEEDTCPNRLTSGDVSALLMVEYLWSEVAKVKAPLQLPDLLSPLSVVWALPRVVLTRAFGDTATTREVYELLLKPPQCHVEGKGRCELFFLQDLITLLNSCGWWGQLQQDAESFLATKWKALLKQAKDASLPDDVALSLPAARLQPCAPATTIAAPLAYVTLSSSEPLTLTLHYYGAQGSNEQHARIDYKPDTHALMVDLPQDMQAMMRARGVNPADLCQVIQSLRANLPETQALMEHGATQVEKISKYHMKNRSGEQRRHSRGSSASGR